MAEEIQNQLNRLKANAMGETQMVFPLSVVIVTCDDDAKFLEGCLMSIPRYSEVIIAYTYAEKRQDYSENNTQRIALDTSKAYCIQNLTVKEIELHYPADDLNMSELRNRSKAHATREFILSLDTDERVFMPLDFIRELYTLSKSTNEIGGFNVLINNFARNTDANKIWTHAQICRLYRNNPEFYYKNRIHEVITPSIVNAGYKIIETAVSILHVGYFFTEPGPLIKKLLRNLKGMYQDLALDYTDIALNDYVFRTLRELRDLGLKPEGSL